MSGLSEGCKEPYSQQASCIISLALFLFCELHGVDTYAHNARTLTPMHERMQTVPL